MRKPPRKRRKNNRRTAQAAARENIIPYKSENGKWIPSPYDGNGWWTGGLLAGAHVAVLRRRKRRFFP